MRKKRPYRWLLAAATVVAAITVVTVSVTASGASNIPRS
jgi:hypothetical protein